MDNTPLTMWNGEISRCSNGRIRACEWWNVVNGGVGFLPLMAETHCNDLLVGFACSQRQASRF